MVTRLMLLMAVLLFSAGCATYETRYVYEDGYYADDAAYVDRGDSRYGDYYVGQRDYRYVDSYYYPAYLEWPAYHSLFWGFNRWYHDPFFYPGYYYGVTYFPRNYLSFTARRGLFAFGVGHGYFPYSPYLFAWHDSYYDWSYWHHHYPSHRQHHRGPRYGSARNEAERLAWRNQTGDARVLRQAASDSTRTDDRRRADYGNRVPARDESRVRGAGARPQQSVRSAESLPQRGSITSGRTGRPVNERPSDRSRAVAQPAMQERKPSSERKPLQRAAPEHRVYRAPPVANRTDTNTGEAVAPRTREPQFAPQVRPVQVRRAYAGNEGYQRPQSAPQPARAQERYQRAPHSAPVVAPAPYERQSRPASSYGQPAPQAYSQPPSGVRQQSPAPPQYREPARAERSSSSSRSETVESKRKSGDER